MLESGLNDSTFTKIVAAEVFMRPILINGVLPIFSVMLL
jgi:hypothetical protein